MNAILVKVLQKIIDKNNTVLIAENREELINNSDYVIKLKGDNLVEADANEGVVRVLERNH